MAENSDTGDRGQKDEYHIHSDIWDRLLTVATDDLVGMVAYGLYQKEKREWIACCQSEKKRFPSKDEVDQFSFSYRDSAINRLLSLAEGRLTEFSSEITEASMVQLQEEAFNQRVAKEVATARDELKAVNNALESKSKDITSIIRERTGIKHHIFGHLAGFSAVVIFGLALTFLLSNEKSPKEIIDHVEDRLKGGGHAVANTPSTAEKPGVAEHSQQPSDTAHHSTPGDNPPAKPSHVNKRRGRGH